MVYEYGGEWCQETTAAHRCAAGPGRGRGAETVWRGGSTAAAAPGEREEGVRVAGKTVSGTVVGSVGSVGNGGNGGDGWDRRGGKGSDGSGEGDWENGGLVRIEDPAGRFGEYFPRLAARDRPNSLYALGDTGLLGRRSVCICGAREASAAARDIAYRCARILAESGVLVISGYARGIDMAAHAGALDAGGETMAILPYGLARFGVRRALRENFEPDRFLALSELPPAWGFSTRHAHRRNALLVAHARAVIVVEPGESGGTWSTIARAMRCSTPLFFHEGERADLVGGLIAAGGRHIGMEGGAPLLGPVMACMETGG